MENLACSSFSIALFVLTALVSFALGYSLGQENSYIHNRISNVHTRIDSVWQSVIKLMRARSTGSGQENGEDKNKP